MNLKEEIYKTIITNCYTEEDKPEDSVIMGDDFDKLANDLTELVKKTVEIKALSNSRTSKQNRALHKFFVIVSNELNNLGIDFKYSGLKGMELSVMHTPEIVKQFIWKPIQLALFNIESTTKLDTEMINKIADVIIRYFGNMGVVLEFPRKNINEI